MAESNDIFEQYEEYNMEFKQQTPNAKYSKKAAADTTTLLMAYISSSLSLLESKSIINFRL